MDFQGKASHHISKIKDHLESRRKKLRRGLNEIRGPRLRQIVRGSSREVELFMGQFAPYVMHALASTAGYGLGLLGTQTGSYASGVSCVSPFASVIGVTGIGCASILAGRFAVAYKLYPDHGHKAFWKTWSTATRSDFMTDAVIGIAMYKLLGGRFRSVLPSDLSYPGAYADRSIIVRSPKASGDQRTANRANFMKSGCHHCGVRWGRRIIADHQPPNKVYATLKTSLNISEKMGLKEFALVAMNFLGESLPPQQLFPQCGRCCSLQAHAVRTNKTVLVMHFGGFRAYHLAGAVVGARYYERERSK